MFNYILKRYSLFFYRGIINGYACIVCRTAFLYKRKIMKLSNLRTLSTKNSELASQQEIRSEMDTFGVETVIKKESKIKRLFK